MKTRPNFTNSAERYRLNALDDEERYEQSPRRLPLNTVLPFTRNGVGPMDYTPVAISPKKFQRTTTAAHELATAIIFTSGITHYADQAKMFESLPPEALKIFRDAPARWDETRCLIGEPGRLAVFARRSGSSWFIAGINGTSAALPVELDLARYDKFRKRLLVSEAAEAIMQVAVARVDKRTAFQHTLPPRGGFILRLDQ